MRIPTYAKGPRSGTKKPHNEPLFAADWLNNSGFTAVSVDIFQRSGISIDLGEDDDDVVDFLVFSIENHFQRPGSYVGSSGICFPITEEAHFTFFSNPVTNRLEALVQTLHIKPTA